MGLTDDLNGWLLGASFVGTPADDNPYFASSGSGRVLDRSFKGKQLVSGRIVYHLFERNRGTLLDMSIMVEDLDADDTFLENQRLRGTCHVLVGNESATAVLGAEKRFPVFEVVPADVCKAPALPNGPYTY